jgi:hypothetical protein
VAHAAQPPVAALIGILDARLLFIELTRALSILVRPHLNKIMESASSPSPVSKAALWTGRVMSALPGLMLCFSAAMKFAGPPELAKGFEHMGIPLGHALGLGLLELLCAVIYLIPRTAVIGAILLTGYLGGAIQTHIRVGDPVYTHIVLGVVIWGGLYLRDPRLRALIPLVR